MEVKRKMAKKNVRKFLVTGIFIIVLLAFSANLFAVSNVYGSEAPIQEKGLSTLNSVLNIDLAKYSVTAKTDSSDTEIPFAYFGVIPQEGVAYSLNSEDSKLKMQYTFGNGKLQMMQVLEKEGALSLSKASTNTDDIELAKDFLTNYQNYTSNDLFGELKSTLNNLTPGKNESKTTGNIALEMNTYNDYTHFKWYYTSNGAKAPYTKYITLVFKNGFLSTFVDNWQYFNVGSTKINLSEEEAISIALNTAKEYAHSLKLDDYEFKATSINQSNVRWTSLLLDNSLNTSKARSEDVLELYPTWQIGVALDKWYGQLYGLQVNIWADTKEVRNVQEAWSNVPPPEGTPTANEDATNQNLVDTETTANMTPMMAFSIFAIILAGTVSISILYRKKQTILGGKLKKRSLKTGGILLCILTICVLLLAPIATVNAWTETAVIWGSESSGADEWGYLPPNYNWRKSAQEREYQRDTSVYLTNWFENEGDYIAYNHQGHRNPGATKTQIISDINIQTRDNSRVAFVTFDHGVGNFINGEFHFMFEDQTGTGIGTHDNHYWDASHGIYDEEIYNTIDEDDRGKTMLAFISTCMSARLVYPQSPYNEWQGLYNGRARGLPFAFTGRTVHPTTMLGFNVGEHMSDDGFEHPDDGSQVFIGFPRGSASLEQGIPYGGGGGNPYYWWVVSFFYNALHSDLSVNQALDAASNQFIGGPFLTTPLHTGFDPYWWNFVVPDEWKDATLEIYGNGRIQLKSFGDDFQDGNYNGWTVNQGSWTVSGAKLRSQQADSLIHTNEQFTTDRHVRAELRTITHGTNSWDVPWVIAKYNNNWGDVVYALIHTDGHVELSVISNGQKAQWDVYGTPLDIYATNTMDIDIVGTKAYVWVNGELYIDVSHDYFDDFGGSAAFCTHGSSTGEFDDITVVNQTPETLDLTVLAYNQYGQPGNVPLYIDGNYVGTTGYAYAVTRGVHQIRVESPLYDGGYHIFDHYYYDGTTNYNNPMSLGITSDKTVTAYYYSY